MAKSTKSAELEVVTLRQEEATFCILGTSPFYCNRVAEKAKRELLLPRGRMTTAQKAQNLKHDPEAEFRASPYLRRGPGPTRIMMLSTAFKKAIAQAALDMPTGVAKSQIGRLTYVVDEYAPIYGIPRLHMAVVRSADIARTPDVRTRARIDAWASLVRVRYVVPMLNDSKVATLLAASGIICGIGDWRQEKGSGNNGLYEIVAQDDPRFVEVVNTGGMEAQDEALANPLCSDPETEDLLAWYKQEVLRRGQPKAKPEEIEEETEVAEAVE